MQTAYEILGVPIEAKQADIRAAYYALARDHHPDCSQTGGDFGPIATAYANLSSEQSRWEYNNKLALSGKLKRCEICLGVGEVEKSVSFTRKELRLCADCNGLGFLRS